MSILESKAARALDSIAQGDKVLQSVTGKGRIVKVKRRRGFSGLHLCSVWLFREGGELQTSPSLSHGGRPSRPWWCWRRMLRDEKLRVTGGQHPSLHNEMKKKAFFWF